MYALVGTLAAANLLALARFTTGRTAPARRAVRPHRGRARRHALLHRLLRERRRARRGGGTAARAAGVVARGRGRERRRDGRRCWRRRSSPAIRPVAATSSGGSRFRARSGRSSRATRCMPGHLRAPCRGQPGGAPLPAGRAGRGPGDPGCCGVLGPPGARPARSADVAAPDRHRRAGAVRGPAGARRGGEPALLPVDRPARCWSCSPSGRRRRARGAGRARGGIGRRTALLVGGHGAAPGAAGPRPRGHPRGDRVARRPRRHDAAAAGDVAGDGLSGALPLGGPCHRRLPGAGPRSWWTRRRPTPRSRSCRGATVARSTCSDAPGYRIPQGAARADA